MLNKIRQRKQTTKFVLQWAHCRPSQDRWVDPCVTQPFPPTPGAAPGQMGDPGLKWT